MKVLIIISALLLSCITNQADACTRVMYKGLNNLVLTARSMDWKEDIMPNLWIFPKGMVRNGEAGLNSLKWTSRFGSVVCSAYDFCSTDGMNEKGLVANLHLSISDAGGDNAIFEYIKGKLHVYHSKEYLTMTNSPTYDKQLALDEYWKEIGGTVMLPGTNRAADRLYALLFIPKPFLKQTIRAWPWPVCSA